MTKAASIFSDDDIYQWIDDTCPHLNNLPFEELRHQPELAVFFQGRSAERIAADRQAAAVKAAATRAKNRRAGITQKNILGSTKQKRWASEIRGNFVRRFQSDRPEVVDYVLENKTSSRTWIEGRHNLDGIAHRIGKALDAAHKAFADIDAYFDEKGIKPGDAYHTSDVRLSDLRKKQRKAISHLHEVA